MKSSLTIVFLFLTSFLFAQQNLVSNPSFEEYVTCPNHYSQFNYTSLWYNCGGTPDYFNTCALSASGISIPENIFGFQFPSSAECNAYAGLYGKCIWSNCREFIGAELISPMIINQKYYFSAKINLTNNSNCGINKLGVLFSTVSHLDNTGLSPMCLNTAHIYTNSIISDTANWTLITGSFIADSAYLYMIFGDLFDDAHTDSIMLNGENKCQAYYFVDDFCVSNDSATCSTFNFICSNNIGENSSLISFSLFPSQAKNEITINYNIKQDTQFELYDITGAKRKVVSLDFKSKNKIIDLSELNSGLYFFSVLDKYCNLLRTGKFEIQK